MSGSVWPGRRGCGDLQLQDVSLWKPEVVGPPGLLGVALLWSDQDLGVWKRQHLGPVWIDCPVQKLGVSNSARTA